MNIKINILKKFLRYLYINFIPEIFKVRISFLFDPLPNNRLRANATIRTKNYYQAYIKELKQYYNKGSKKNFYLHEAFKKHLVRSNLIDEKWWLDLIYLVKLSDESDFQKTNQSLINRIENSNFDSLEYFEILDIYNLCLRLCFFELAYYLRKKAINVALGYSNFHEKKKWKLKAKLSALLENKNFLEFDQLLPKIESLQKYEKRLFVFLRNALEGKKNSTSINSPYDKVMEKDQKFKKFVENKKIAIVSPSPVEEKDGLKIDSADLVIRTNYKIGDKTIKGSRCDISYFNLETVKIIVEKGCTEFPTNISWIVARVLDQVEMIFKRLITDGVNVENFNGRNLERVDGVLFNGSLTSIQNIVLDLFKFNPKEIFLYHFDVMLTKERIEGYYPKERAGENLHLYMINSFIGHDPVTNFLILKSFWKQGFIKGDLRFESLMKMETKDYMKIMQKKYRITNFFEKI